MAVFWSDASVEPKRSWRWVGYINLHGGKNVEHEFGPKPFLVKSFIKPRMSFPSEKMVNNFTSESQVITKHYEWGNTTIEIYDIENAELNASKAIFNWIAALGYEPVQNIQKLSDLFTNLQDEKISLTIAQLDSKGKQIETWDFVKPAIIDIDFGGVLDYETDAMPVVTLEFMCTAVNYTHAATEATAEGITETLLSSFGF